MISEKEIQQSEKEQQEVVVRGVVEHVTFYNPDNNYSVLQIKLAEQSEQITVVGNCINATVGMHLLVRGEYKLHPRFGRQLAASSITPVTPSTKEGIERYLGSGLIKGIGPKTARRMVEKFGTDTFEVIHRSPEKIATIPGIGAHKAELISEAFAEQQDIREIMRFLVEHNISTGLASRIYEHFKSRAVEVLSKDPYLLARQLRGVGFATADTIALNLGMALDAPQRLKAGLYYALEKARDDGHCYLPLDTLLQRAAFHLGLEEELDLKPQIESLISDGYIVQEEDRLFLRRLYEAEDFVANFVALRTKPFDKPIVDPGLFEKSLKAAETALGIEFSAEQQQAASFAATYPLLLITGGPGCGKTTVIRALVTLFQNAKKRIALAAPTGRAAQRMTQVCNVSAKTIHRLLRFDPIKKGFLYGISNPLQVDDKDVEVVIIDESSMIDLNLARDLFAAIPQNAILILVGDKDQLPSVGPGRVFADLIGKIEIKTITLSRLFRRAEASTINSVAHMINAGLTPEIPEPDGETKVDAYFINRRDTEAAGKTIEALVQDQVPRKFGFKSSEIAVLTPSNRGPLGTIALNEQLQAALNPPDHLKAELKLNNQIFRVGDRVCQRINNYNIDPYGVFNGDTGYVQAIDRAKQSLVVEFWDGRLVKFDKGVINQLSLAYAVTVHRSQGTEIPCVIMVLHESHFTLLERQLIYTGVTRAKELLIVVGSKRALALAARRNQGNRRCTWVKMRIDKLLSE